MINSKIQVNFFYLFFFSILVVTFFIFLPFLKILFLAVVLSVVFYPIFKRITRLFKWRGGRNLAAIITVLVILLAILLPFAGLSVLVIEEVKDVYSNLSSDMSGNSLASFISDTVNYVNSILPANIPQVSVSSIQEYIGQGYDWIFSHFASVFSSAFRLIVSTFIMILALFFLLRDGGKFKDAMINLSPLRDTYDEDIIDKVKQAINSVIKGSLLIALLQGILAAIGFTIFGVPSAILWGAVAVLAAIIPSIGTSIVILPAVIFLLFTEGIFPAIGLALWGVLIVGLIDNVLAPLVIERGIKIHPFLILLSVLGGLSLFGPVGFLAGPVILSLFFALLDIYHLISGPQKNINA